MQIAVRQPARLKVDGRDLAARHAPRPWMQDLWLWILLLGPVVAPVFMLTGQPLFQFIAEGIYMLGDAVCPKVDFHFMFMGQPLAVCSSCWAAVFGLWTVRLVYGRAGEGFGPFARLGLSRFWSRWQATSLETRLAVLAMGFLPWATDVMLTDMRIWFSPHPVMMLAGYLGGLTAAMLLFPARSQMRARLERQGVD
ncbi:MAG: hypothetical protein M3437_11335 [Chloroflexota bacterium]|nr:hypothetical protein [Chloroflexota bacterium]MDQ5864348.1 hypothetical protein [Chloroflexota bacterium]